MAKVIRVWRCYRARREPSLHRTSNHTRSRRPGHAGGHRTDRRLFQAELEPGTGGYRHRAGLLRGGPLGPVATVNVFLRQILFGNVAYDGVPHLVWGKMSP